MRFRVGSHLLDAHKYLGAMIRPFGKTQIYCSPNLSNSPALDTSSFTHEEFRTLYDYLGAGSVLTSFARTFGRPDLVPDGFYSNDVLLLHMKSMPSGNFSDRPYHVSQMSASNDNGAGLFKFSKSRQLVRIPQHRFAWDNENNWIPDKYYSANQSIYNISKTKLPGWKSDVYVPTPNDEHCSGLHHADVKASNSEEVIGYDLTQGTKPRAVRNGAWATLVVDTINMITQGSSGGVHRILPFMNPSSGTYDKDGQGMEVSIEVTTTRKITGSMKYSVSVDDLGILDTESSRGVTAFNQEVNTTRVIKRDICDMTQRRVIQDGELSEPSPMQKYPYYTLGIDGDSVLHIFGNDGIDNKWHDIDHSSEPVNDCLTSVDYMDRFFMEGDGLATACYSYDSDLDITDKTPQLDLPLTAREKDYPNIVPVNRLIPPRFARQSKFYPGDRMHQQMSSFFNIRFELATDDVVVSKYWPFKQ